MLGKKRRNVSLSSNTDVNPFQSKRLAPESPFGGQAPAAAESKLAASPLLEKRKAAREHVRALNTEFASWVQSQLQNHPDELWEDGVRDYLTHSSDILEKFSDVVNWLKTNAGSDGGVSNVESGNIEKTNGPDTISKEKPVPVKSVFGMPANNVGLTSSSSPVVSTTPASAPGTAASAPSWSFGLSTSGQTTSPVSGFSSGLVSTSPTTSGLFPTTSTTSGLFSTSSTTSGSFSTSSTASGLLSTTSTNPGLFSTSPTTSSFFSTGLSPSFSTAPSFTTPWSAGAFATSQTTFGFGGNHSSAPSVVATEVADEDDEPEQPSSPSLKKSEEDGILVVHETKCKLFLKSTDPADKEPWKDKGIGQLFIKCEEGASKGTKESKPRILVRNDVGRIMLNASLYSGIKTNLQKNAIVAIFHTLDESAGDGGISKAIARTFLIRVKNEEERNKLADAIHEHAPAA